MRRNANLAHRVERRLLPTSSFSRVGCVSTHQSGVSAVLQGASRRIAPVCLPLRGGFRTVRHDALPGCACRAPDAPSGAQTSNPLTGGSIDRKHVVELRRPASSVVVVRVITQRPEGSRNESVFRCTRSGTRGLVDPHDRTTAATKKALTHLGLIVPGAIC